MLVVSFSCILSVLLPQLSPAPSLCLTSFQNVFSRLWFHSRSLSSMSKRVHRTTGLYMPMPLVLLFATKSLFFSAMVNHSLFLTPLPVIHHRIYPLSISRCLCPTSVLAFCLDAIRRKANKYMLAQLSYAYTALLSLLRKEIYQVCVQYVLHIRLICYFTCQNRVSSLPSPSNNTLDSYLAATQPWKKLLRHSRAMFEA